MLSHFRELILKPSKVFEIKKWLRLFLIWYKYSTSRQEELSNGKKFLQHSLNNTFLFCIFGWSYIETANDCDR